MRSELFAERKNIIKNVRKDLFLQKQLEYIRNDAESLKNSNINSLSFSDFKTFYNTGSRKEYEHEYFNHRRRLNAFAVMSVIYEEDKEYIEYLQDAIWAVLDEFTWALPAHIALGTRIEACKTQIDLFAAETAFTLSEILNIFTDRLDPMIMERINFEVRNRVLEPYLSGKENSWEALTNNWAAVCAGSVGGAFLYLADDNEISRVLPRIKKTLSCYLRGFGDDGACVEGINYWIYGFGYFTYFAQLLYRYTNGAEDLFDNEKVREIALFQQKIKFKNNKTVSFSDCRNAFVHMSGLSHFLKKKYDSVILPDDSSSIGFDGDSCYRFAHLIRNFAWRDTALQIQALDNEGVEYFKDAAWYIKRTKSYEFAAKAGSNNESHNHNDIASFLLNADGKSVIADPGRGEYTAEYFGNGRYEYFAPSALAHSVPIINGKLQAAGEQHTGVIKEANNDCLVIDFEKAYDDAGLDKITRIFEFNEDTIFMTDKLRFNTEPESITEHFIMQEKPDICDGGLIIGNTYMMYNTNDVKCSVYEKSFSDGNNQNKTVYIADLQILDPKMETEIKLEFRIKTSWTETQ